MTRHQPTPDMASDSTSLEQLANIFKLDYTLLLDDKPVNESNFFELGALIADLVAVLKSRHEHRTLLEQLCDKLFHLCIARLFDLQVDVTGSKNGVAQWRRRITNSNEPSRDSPSGVDFSADVFLKFVRTCAAHASSPMLAALLQLYTVLFIKYTGVTTTNEQQQEVELGSLMIGEERLRTSNISSFLASFSSVLTSRACLSRCGDALIESRMDTLIERLVVLNLDVLYDESTSAQSTTATTTTTTSDDERSSALANLCVESLAAVAASARWTSLILRRSFERLASSLRHELYFVDEQQSTSLSSSVAAAASLSVTSKKRLESFVQDRNLSLLTALADHLMSPMGAELIRSSEFWHLIQTGLGHTNALSRKRALYLLKRANDSGAAAHLRSAYEPSGGCALYDSAWPAWNAFFVCIEMLEETSTHIIKPALVKVTNLVEAMRANAFHFSWLLVLFNRSFMHESKYVVRWSVSAFLQQASGYLTHTASSSSSANNPSALTAAVRKLNEFIFGSLFLVLQRSFLYHKYI